MRKLTLAQVRSPIARVLGMNSSDSRVLEYVNEAQERLLNRPNDPVGSWMRYQVCAGSANCLVLPRQVRTVLAFWICKQPVRFVSEWFEAIGWDEGGYGMRDSDDGNGKLLIDHGRDCVFSQPVATSSEPRKIQAVASDASDNGKTIHIRYIDSNGQRKYSSIDGSIQEGETLTLSTSGVLTSSTVASNSIYHVVKATTNYPVRLYSYDTNSATQAALLATYDPSETLPNYRKVFVPGLSDMSACEGVDSDCSANKTVTILARLNHVPVIKDNDPLVLTNLPALKDMVQAILMRERHEHEAANALEASAAGELDGEIASYLGDGMVMQVKVDAQTFGAGGVVNAV